MPESTSPLPRRDDVHSEARIEHELGADSDQLVPKWIQNQPQGEFWVLTVHVDR